MNVEIILLITVVLSIVDTYCTYCIRSWVASLLKMVIVTEDVVLAFRLRSNTHSPHHSVVLTKANTKQLTVNHHFTCPSPWRMTPTAI